MKHLIFILLLILCGSTQKTHAGDTTSWMPKPKHNFKIGIMASAGVSLVSKTNLPVKSNNWEGLTDISKCMNYAAGISIFITKKLGVRALVSQSTWVVSNAISQRTVNPVSISALMFLDYRVNGPRNTLYIGALAGKSFLTEQSNYHSSLPLNKSVSKGIHAGYRISIARDHVWFFIEESIIKTRVRATRLPQSKIAYEDKIYTITSCPLSFGLISMF